MAWLQNLAGHAENLLNKIDQNAATVLNDGKSVITDIEAKGHEYCNDSPETDQFEIESTSIQIIKETEEIADPELFNNQLAKCNESTSILTESCKPAILNEENVTSKHGISDHSSMSSTSLHNSFIEMQEIDSLNTKIARLEMESQEVHKQLLNTQCLYSEIRNENRNLHSQIEHLNEQLVQTQTEKEQYVIRAQRILQEKEKLILLNQSSPTEESKNIFAEYNVELKKEVEFLQDKVKELNENNAKLLNNMHDLQIQNQVIHNGLSHSNQLLEHSLSSEKKNRIIAEEDCTQKSQELQSRHQELQQLQDLLKNKNEENNKLKTTLSKLSGLPKDNEYDSRIKSLTQALIFKQNSLETITTERNALRLQLEKLQVENEKKINDLKMDKVRVINIQELTDERSYLPHFMRVSPLDASVTRRMKHAYSTLDALSVKTGLFLRRYPVARVFLFCYVVILHIWVLIVLLCYIPSNQ